MVHRAWHATRSSTRGSGHEHGALRGLTQQLSALVKRAKSRHFVIVFDNAESTWRHRLAPDYKANRKRPEPELSQQLEYAPHLLTALGFQTFCIPGFEADDLFATLVDKARQEGLGAWLVSPDKDLFQLVRDAEPTVFAVPAVACGGKLISQTTAAAAFLGGELSISYGGAVHPLEPAAAFRPEALKVAFRVFTCSTCRCALLLPSLSAPRVVQAGRPSSAN